MAHQTTNAPTTTQTKAVLMTHQTAKVPTSQPKASSTLTSQPKVNEQFTLSSSVRTLTATRYVTCTQGDTTTTAVAASAHFCTFVTRITALQIHPMQSTQPTSANTQSHQQTNAQASSSTKRASQQSATSGMTTMSTAEDQLMQQWMANLMSGMQQLDPTTLALLSSLPPEDRQMLEAQFGHVRMTIEQS